MPVGRANKHTGYIMTQQAEALRGLTSGQAEQLHRDGKGNLPPKNAGRTVGQIFLKNIFTWFNILNFILAMALLWVKSYRNMLFMGVVVLNTLISTVQEVRAKKTVDKLTLLVAAPVPVMRDGKWTKLASEELVEGDLVRFSAGDQVCADAQVLSGQGSADEALLTGESDAVPKAPEDLLYSGSVITEGKLYARLIRVGNDCYAGQLAQSVRKEKAVKSQLMEDLKKLIRFISFFLLPIGLALFYKQYWRLDDSLEAAIPTTVAAILGMIPEGLLLLTSMALAVGVVRLGQKDTLVQELYGIENLARVDVLCVDKTGTITQGCLHVQEVIPLESNGMESIDASMRRMLQASEDDNLTFQALRSHWGGLIPASEPVALRIPFSSARKWSAVAFSAHGTTLIGAPEFILKDRMSKPLADRIAGFADQGFRVILLAHSPAFPQDNALPLDINPQALILLNDQIREDFAGTAHYLAREGVQVKVISGDNPRTVAEVARRAGLAGAENWTDASLWLDDGELARAAKQFTVFGRVAPDQKRKLVLALKDAGHTVAMVGDGVNDVPALKVCDCAIAMAGGSDAAQKTSQLTLLGGNFSAIPQVILEGRRVINNIGRSASLFLVKTVFSFLLSLLTLMLPMSYPFRPIQMTLISSFTVGIPSFFLAMEPNRERVKGNFLTTVLQNALPGGLTNGLLILLLFILSGPMHLSHHERSTIAVAAAGVTGVLILAWTSRPLTLMRGALILAVAAGMLFAALFFSSFFFLVPLTGPLIWLTVALAALSPLLLWLMRRAVERVVETRQSRKGQSAPV